MEQRTDGGMRMDAVLVNPVVYSDNVQLHVPEVEWMVAWLLWLSIMQTFMPCVAQMMENIVTPHSHLEFLSPLKYAMQ